MVVYYEQPVFIETAVNHFVNILHNQNGSLYSAAVCPRLTPGKADNLNVCRDPSCPSLRKADTLYVCRDHSCSTPRKADKIYMCLRATVVQFPEKLII